MLRASWYDHKITSLHILIFTVDGRFAGSRRECQGLINGVYLRNHSIINPSPYSVYPLDNR